MKNDDETFFQQFHKAPRQEFADALYQRINKPMNAQKTHSNTRRTQKLTQKLALTFAAAAAVLLAIVFAIPTTRASALSLVRQIGSYLVVQSPPPEAQPTAMPDQGVVEAVFAETASQASAAAGFTVLAPGALPEGYAQTGPFSVAPNGKGNTVVSSYRGADDKFLHINQYQVQTGDTYTDYVAGQETLADVTVRGAKGVWITERMMTDPTRPELSDKKYVRPTGWLIWEENGVVTIMMSDGLTLEQALDVAESMK